MAYADYTFYSGTYMGTLPQAEFERLAERASDYIDSRTNYAFISSIPEVLQARVKKACCAVADAMQINASGVKQSESVDGYSVTYASSAHTDSDIERLDRAIRLYIDDYVKAVSWV